MIKALNEISEIVRYKELLRNLVARDIKVRYKRSVLGFFWVMLHPLLMMLILSMVFSELFNVSTKNFSVYVLSGIILWNFISQSTLSSVESFRGNSELIKKVYLPKAIFPISVILSSLIHFVFSLVPLFIIFFILGTTVSAKIFILPLVIIMVILFSFGISLIVSTLTVFFHDTKYIYDVLLLAGMYATPIFYPESIVPQKYAIILQLNPICYFLATFRMALYLDGQYLLEKLLYGFLFSIVTLVLGWFFYNQYKDRIVYYL
jgi:ABC-type polysaccharide/polyol phosphate export permease